MASTMRLRPDLKPGVATSTTAIARAADQLQQPGGDPAAAQRTEVAAEPAVGADRGEVVDQAEEPEAEHREQHLAARAATARLVADAERAEARRGRPRSRGR